MLPLVRLSVKRQLYGAVRPVELLRVPALNAVALAGQATHCRGRSPQVYCWKTARQGNRKRQQELIGSFFALSQYHRIGSVQRHIRGSVEAKANTVDCRRGASRGVKPTRSHRLGEEVFRVR